MKFLPLLVFTILTTACATEYTQYSIWRDGGFTETELQPNLYNVRFSGNAFTSIERASEFSMLRAAELCLARNFAFLEIYNLSTVQRVSGSTSDSSITNANATTNESGVSVSSTTTYNQGSIIYSPDTGLTVQCLGVASATSWDAGFLEQSLKAKYQIE